MPISVVKGSRHVTEDVVISREEHESLLRTIEFLSDPDAVRLFLESGKAIEQGKFKTLDQWAKERGLV